jgi:hypothetical protein
MMLIAIYNMRGNEKKQVSGEVLPFESAFQGV